MADEMSSSAGGATAATGGATNALAAGNGNNISENEYITSPLDKLQISKGNNI